MAFVSGQRVADYLGRGDDVAFVALAGQHAEIVTAFVKAYVRGRGFDTAGFPGDDLAAVIVTSAARLVTNPELGGQQSVGAYTTTPGVLDGWTLPELAVLHRYRRRAA